MIIGVCFSVDTMVSRAALGASKVVDDASIFSVALVGGMLGAAFALFIRLLVVCFAAVWECSPEEEAMVVILTSPDEKETPLLPQVGQLTLCRRVPVFCEGWMNAWGVSRINPLEGKK